MRTKAQIPRAFSVKSRLEYKNTGPQSLCVHLVCIWCVCVCVHVFVLLHPCTVRPCLEYLSCDTEMKSAADRQAQMAQGHVLMTKCSLWLEMLPLTCALE